MACTSVLTASTVRYCWHIVDIFGVISITVVVDGVFIDDVGNWCHIDRVHTGS